MGEPSDKETEAEKFDKPNKKPIWIWAVVTILKVCFTVYDAISFMPTQLIASPSRIIAKSKKIKAAPTVKGDPSSPWRNVSVIDRPLKSPEVFPGCDTLAKTWDECVRRYGNLDCFGTREIYSVTKELQPDGRYFEKLELGQYHWKTYTQVNEEVSAVAKGLLEIGQKEKEMVVIFAGTCAEWMISALACFKCNFPVTTVYATLGEEAVLYAINECRATTIFVSDANMPKVAKVSKNLEFIKTVIHFASEDPASPQTVVPQELVDAGKSIYSYKTVVRMGKKSGLELQDSVKPDDLALIMYTSGSTGTPKGVLITHKNILSAVSGQCEILRFRSNDVGIGYLPLAHIYEICIELNLFVNGCKFGFASPQTLLDNSPRLKKGQIGDCRMLKPTLVTFVPTIMNRLYKEITAEVSRQSPLFQELFRACYDWRQSRWRRAYPNSFFDRLAFKKIRALLGGRVRMIFCGSAPLNVKTQEFIEICFDCQVAQAYGLTETTGGGTIATADDRSMGSVGSPESTIEILLREWPEGGYLPTNEKPQGEILLTGDCITLGYLNNPEKTNEDYIELNGKRWFTTGDIGEFREDGSLRIIDRKKDLVKLAHGEYISLGQIEAVILTNPLVENICVCAGLNKSYVVALVVPNLKNVKELAEKAGVTEQNSEQLCANEKVQQQVLSEIKHFCKGKLTRVQIPQQIHLCPSPWLPATGLVTESLKVKRKMIENTFKNEINQMYSDKDA